LGGITIKGNFNISLVETREDPELEEILDALPIRAVLEESDKGRNESEIIYQIWTREEERTYAINPDPFKSPIKSIEKYVYVSDEDKNREFTFRSCSNGYTEISTELEIKFRGRTFILKHRP